MGTVYWIVFSVFFLCLHVTFASAHVAKSDFKLNMF